MSVIFRLYQEGDIRLNGFQATEWVDSNPAYTTTQYNKPFVLRRNGYGLPDSFVRVAAPPDFGALLVNPLTGFDIKQPFDVEVGPPSPGDTLRIKVTNVPHWATATSINSESYVPSGDDYIEFTITNYSAWRYKQPGDPPPSVTGHNLTVPTYLFTEEDIGRSVRLSGFSNSANNTDAVVVNVAGGTAITDATFVTEAGTLTATWSIFRLNIDAVKPFPRIDTGMEWEIVSGGSTILAGRFGGTMRADDRLEVFRDDRVTSVNSTIEIAQNHFTLVQSYFRSLQAQLGEVDGAFGSVGPYDFGP
jgi:hypothetical protein